MGATKKARPYWHVDLKWIFGILLFLSLTVSSTLFVVSTLLSPKIALTTATHIVANQFSKNGLDDTVDIEKFKEQVKKSDQTVYKPIKGLDVTITKQELLTLSAREIRLKIFSQIVKPIYYGTEKLNDKALEQYGALVALNEKTYQTLYSLFWWSLLPVVLFMSATVFFSYRYGRLISPAVMLLVFGTLPTLLLWLVQNTTPPAGDAEPLSFLPTDTTKDIANALTPYFATLFITGIVLLLAIPALKVISKLKLGKK